MLSLLINWYGCRGCIKKFESSIKYNSFFCILLIIVSQRFTVIRKLTVFRKMRHNIWLCSDLEYFLFLDQIKNVLFVTILDLLILRQTVDRVENIGNYLGNCLVDNYAVSYLDTFRTLRIFCFRSWSTRIDYEHPGADTGGGSRVSFDPPFFGGQT